MIYPVEQCQMFENEASRCGLYVVRRLYVSSRPDVPPIRTIVELSRKQCEIECDTLHIENGARHDFSDKYKSLTRDYYLKF